MRRSDREITDRAEIEGIIQRACICHLALNDNGKPYVVPLNYGYDGGCLYIHSAVEGRKIDILRRDPAVAFCIYIDAEVMADGRACGWGMKYRCVMGEGTASLLEGAADKERALGIILQQHGSLQHEFDPAQVAKVSVIRIAVSSLTGKKARC